MSNIVALTANTVAPAIPQQFMELYNQKAQELSQQFGGSFNRIRPGKMDFTLIEGGVARQVPNGSLAGVLLGVADHDFCTWYEKNYQPGQEPEKPDLVWNWPDHDKFPDALPAHFHKKQLINGAERFAFRTARRSVWALIRQDANGQYILDLDNPYILDITSMSLYGKVPPTLVNTYKFTGLFAWCKRFSQPPNFVCSPAMFPTQIILDGTVSVSGVVMFRPSINQDGSPQYISNDDFARVCQVMFSGAVQDMLKVQEILDYKGNASAQGTPVNTPPQMIVPPQAAPVTPPPAPSAPQPAPVSVMGSEDMGQPQPASQPQSLLAQAQEALAQEENKNKGKQWPGYGYAGADGKDPTPALNAECAAELQKMKATAPVQPTPPVQPAPPVQAATQQVSSADDPRTAAAANTLNNLLSL